MSKNKRGEFLKKAGGCIVSKNIVDGKGKLRWLLREKSLNPADNGWCFFSDIDDDEFVNDPQNLVVCDFNTVVEIEPAIIAIYPFPVGSDMQCKYWRWRAKQIEKSDL
jgi:hypothetical protein